ncbi:MAG: hypothetical protein DLM57_02415 [Pseudonocardiales bacterium]|nr:MAG: hypothetical protein DLM57_02415 [Pseudonocardiales bacterium]
MTTNGSTQDIPPLSGRVRWAEGGGYFGAALTAAAGLELVGQSWDSFDRSGHVALLGGIGLTLLVAGAVIGGVTIAGLRAVGHTGSSARRRLVSTLFTFASVPVAAAVAVFMVGEHSGAAIAASGAGLAVAGIGYALVPSLLGQLVTWLGAYAVLSSVIDKTGSDDYHVQAVQGALAILVLGVVWAGLARVKVFAETYTAYGVGAASALNGAQTLLSDERTWSYALTALVAVACFAGFGAARNWLVLATGMLATLLVVPEALADWTGSDVGGAVGFLIVGVATLAASSLGLGRRRHGPRYPVGV